jgi:hypothetical protein
MLKNKAFVFHTFFLLLAILSYFGIDTVLAQERIESANYRIVFPNFNSGAGIPTSDNYSVNSTIGQTAAGQFASSGYRVKSGFQYISSIIPFSFSISDIQKNFGTLAPDSPSTSTSTIVVSAGGAGGYSVKASENNPLQTAGGLETIVDTLCDTTCSETTAGSWTSSIKYGFGFNMSGDDVPTDFTNSNYFRQFSDRSNAESPATIMTSNNVGRERTAVITYKINISNIQPSGTYKNIITFTAVPSY